MAITKKDSTESWLDAQGDWVPVRHIKPVDKKRDRAVEKIIKEAERLNQDIARFRRLCDDTIEDFLTYSLKETGEKPGGKKSVTLSNFSYTAKVERADQDFIDFDERLIRVKELIDECIKEWGADAPSDLVTIITKVFETDKKGRLNIKGLLSLQNLNVTNGKWKKAMSILTEAKRVVASKTYIRFFTRPPGGSYKSILLDFASIDPAAPDQGDPQ